MRRPASAPLLRWKPVVVILAFIPVLNLVTVPVLLLLELWSLLSRRAKQPGEESRRRRGASRALAVAALVLLVCEAWFTGIQVNRAVRRGRDRILAGRAERLCAALAARGQCTDAPIPPELLPDASLMYEAQTSWSAGRGLDGELMVSGWWVQDGQETRVNATCPCP